MAWWHLVIYRANKSFTAREFPSLSGAPQPTQAQNPSQMVWANANQRAAQTPVQRQQPPPTTQAPSRASQTPSNHPQQQSQPPHDDLFPSGVQFANRLDDFRNGGQGISGQLGGGQPQTGSIDEFPPLGRNVAAEIGQDRRGSVMQNAGFGSFNAGIGFQGQSAQTRNIMAASVNGQETGRMMSPANMSPAGMLATQTAARVRTDRVFQVLRGRGRQSTRDPMVCWAKKKR